MRELWIANFSDADTVGVGTEAVMISGILSHLSYLHDNLREQRNVSRDSSSALN